MGRDPRVTKAFKAMKAMDIAGDKIKPVLKHLLKIYDKNWELIEAENYRVLADAIFEEEDNKTLEQQGDVGISDKEPLTRQEPVPPLKRLCRGLNPLAHPSTIGNSSPRLSEPLSKRPNMEVDELPASSSQKKSHDKGKSPKSDAGNVRAETQCLRLKDEPFTDDMFANNTPQYVVPLAVIPLDSLSKGDSSTGNVLIGAVGQEHPASQHVEGEHRVNGVLASSTERVSNGDIPVIHEKSSPNLEIASSSMGEVKISLKCNTALGRQNFHMPSLNELRELMEERCLRSYKIDDPNFSVMNVMKDVCDCFLELATINPSNELQDNVKIVTPSIDQLEKSTALDANVMEGTQENPIFLS